MENFQRDVEKIRLKKDVTGNLKHKWSVLIINSTGKVLTIPYLKPIAVFTSILVVSSILALTIVSMVASTSLKKNNILKTSIEELNKKNNKLKTDNEVLISRLALLEAVDMPSVINTEKKAEKKAVNKKVEKPVKPKKVKKKENKALKALSLKEEKPKTVKPAENKQEVKKEEPRIIKPVEKPYGTSAEANSEPVSLNGMTLKKAGGRIQVGFNIRNIKKTGEAASGYIFVILKNSEKAQPEVISPYSAIKEGLPVMPSRGQYFSIQRFKPVKIKFGANLMLEKFNTAEILIYSVEKNLVLKRDFIINEKN